MANQNDAGRDTRLLLTLVAAGVAVVVGGSYALWSWLSTPEAVVSSVDINRVGAASTGRAKETPAYRELLGQYNSKGVADARAKNNSFIASIPLESDVVKLPAPTRPPAAPPQPRARTTAAVTSQGSNANDKQNERRQKALDDILSQLKPKSAAGDTSQSASTLTLARSLDGLGQGGQGGGMAGFADWRGSLPGGARPTPASLSGGAPGADSVPVEVVKPYFRGPGVIDIGVDSDNVQTPVLGRFLSGPYAGAVLKAPDGAKLAGEGVVIHFTEMALGGVNYRVDAYALQDDTLVANIASSVNHRYFERIVLPSVFKGIGGIGQLYEQANTQVVTNGFNAITTRPGTPDGKAVAGVIAGGTANQAANVLASDAAKVPPLQVTVDSGQVVAIQFMRGVYQSDAIKPGEQRERVLPALPASGMASPHTPQTNDDWRAQTRARIEAQRRLQQERGTGNE